MYCNYFGFSEKPFDITPDPKFLYLSDSHQEILASLVYGIRERRGFIKIVGEVGTGKTMLLNAMLLRLDSKVKTSFLFNTDLTFKQIMLLVLGDLGINKSVQSITTAEAILRLNKFATEQLAKGGTVVLVIDEAQNLTPRSLENLRMLSNLETHKHKLVQIILSGQPELDRKLNQPNLRQLAQRINLQRYTAPLDEQGTVEYIHHRLKTAKGQNLELFNSSVQKLIWNYSQGIPRKINVLCDNALLIAYAMNKKTVNKKIVKEVIRDLTDRPFSNYRATDPQLMMT